MNLDTYCLHMYLPTSVPTYLPANPHKYLQTYYLSMYLLSCVPIYPTTYMPTDLHTYLPIYIPVYVPTHKPAYVSTYVSTYILSTLTPMNLPTCLPIYCNSWTQATYMSRVKSSYRALWLRAQKESQTLRLLFQDIHYKPHALGLPKILDNSQILSK